VVPPPKSRILEVYFQHDNPRKTQQILKIHLKLYLSYHAEVFAVRGAMSLFKERLDKFKAEYMSSVNKLIKFRQKWGLSYPEKQQEFLISLTKQLSSRITELEGQAQQFKSMLTAIERDDIPTGQLLQSQNQVISVMAAQILRAMEKNMEMRQTFHPASRNVVESGRHTEELKVQFQKILQGQLDNVLAQKNTLEASLKRHLTRLQQLEDKSQEAEPIELEAAIAKQRYLRYSDKVEEVRISDLMEGSNVVNVKVVSQPYLPSSKIFPRTGMYVMGAFALAFPLGIGIILVTNIFDRSFESPQQVEQTTGFPVLASLNKLSPV
jgi:uncharacterized protein involved in exopolysaccharide biosynthesis